jgi:hypothetical protein
MGGYLFELFGRKIAPVIAVKDIWNPTCRPPRIILPTDREPEGQPCLIRTGDLETEPIAHHRSAILIQNDGQIRTGRFAFLIDQPDIEPTVISLPPLIRSTYLMQEEHIIFLLIHS